jgi:hypothetical protein
MGAAASLHDPVIDPSALANRNSWCRLHAPPRGDPMTKLARMIKGRRTVPVGVAAFAMAASGALVASNAVTPPPAHNDATAGLKQVGPIDETDGFPMCYKDANTTSSSSSA